MVILTWPENHSKNDNYCQERHGKDSQVKNQSQIMRRLDYLSSQIPSSFILLDNVAKGKQCEEGTFDRGNTSKHQCLKFAKHLQVGELQL